MTSYKDFTHKQSPFMNCLFKGIIATAILFLFISCNTGKKEFLPPIFEKQVKLKHTVIQDTLLLHSPKEIISFDKYVVMNTLTDGRYLHVYDKQTGEYLGGYVRNGQGPGEVATHCERIDYNKNERTITMSEMNTNHCFIFMFNDDLENLLTFETKINFSNDNKEGFERLFGFFRIDKNLYLSDYRIFPPSKNQNRRFSLIAETGEKTSKYNGFATDDFWAYTFISQRISVSPNRKKMACTTFYGAVLETFEVGDSIHLIQEKLFYPIILNIKNDIAYLTDKTIQGFLDICTSDEYIFSILIGSTESNNKNISVFNWNGDPVIRFETDIDIYNICYNEDDNLIYAIAMTEDYDYILVTFDIADYL